MSLILEQGSVYNLDDIVSDLKYTSSWKNGAAKLEFTMLPKLEPQNGSYLTFSFQERNLFAGRIFVTKLTEDGEYSVTAYDQLRYLKAKDTLMRKDSTLSQFVEQAAANLGLRIHSLADTQLKLNDYLFSDKTYLDMIYQSISDNLLANTYYYCLYDDFGALRLTDLLDMRLPLIIGEESLGYKFNYEKSIDKDTYNVVKLAFDNNKTAKRDLYIAQDSGNIARYGTLQYFSSVSSGNSAQITERSALLLKLKNRETKTLSVDALGDTRVRGGSGIRVVIAQAGIDFWAIVDKVVHKINKGIHTMSLDLIIEGIL